MVLDVKFAPALPVPIATPSSFNELRQNRHFSQGDSGDFVTDCSPSVSRPVCVDRTPGTSSVPTRYIGPARRLHLSMLPGTLVHSANFLVALVSFFATVRLISPLQKDALRINITPPPFSRDDSIRQTLSQPGGKKSSRKTNAKATYLPTSFLMPSRNQFS